MIIPNRADIKVRNVDEGRRTVHNDKGGIF